MVIKKLKKLAKSAKKKYDELNKEPDKSEQDIDMEVGSPIEREKVYFDTKNVAKSVLIIIGLLALSWIVIEISNILFIFFIALLFAAALDPAVDKLEEYKIPRGISVVFIFIIIITLIILFITNLLPILATELTNLGIRGQEIIGKLARGEVELPQFLAWLNPLVSDFVEGLNAEGQIQELQRQLLTFGDTLTNFARNAFDLLFSIFNGIANAIFVLFLTYFMTVDEKAIDKFTLSIFPNKYGKYIGKKTEAIKSKVGEWLRGQLLLMLAVGVATYIGLLILGMDYAFTLAIFAGLTEVIPIVGPLIAWIAAIPIAANHSGAMILWVTILYFVIQRLENNLLVPVIMNKATGLNPIVVLFAVMVGFKFAGIIGVIISIPVTAVLAIFLTDMIKKHNSKKKKKS